MSWFFEGFFVEAAFLLPLQSSCLLSCVTSAAVRSLSMVWQRGDSSYTSERILKYRSGLKRHFPVRVILKMSLWNFLPPAFSGSFSYSWDKEPEVVISLFRHNVASFPEMFCQPAQKLLLQNDFICIFIFFRNGFSWTQELSMFLILQTITFVSCHLWTSFSYSSTVLATLTILLKYNSS